MRVVLIAALFAGFAAAQNPIAPLAQNAFGTIATIPNSSTGTTINKLASLSGGKAIITTAGATSGVIGIVIGGAGAAGSATVQTEASSVSCVFDGATTAGDYVQISASVNGDCTDAGATLPSSGQALGTVLSTNGGGGNYKMLLNASGAFVSSSGGGTPSGCSANQLPVAGASVGLPFTCPGATLTGGALVLSASGTASSLTFGNATSGTLTIQPVTGALGTVTISAPASTGTIALTNIDNLFSAGQTISAGTAGTPFAVKNASAFLFQILRNTDTNVQFNLANKSAVQVVSATEAVGNDVGITTLQLKAGGTDVVDITSSAATFNQPISATSLTASGTASSALYATATNCSSSASPAVCAAAAAGSVVVAAAATTVTVNTTAVTANSQILVFYDSSLGTKLGVTCNTTEPALYGVTARVAATSFTLTSSAPITNPACFSYIIIN